MIPLLNVKIPPVSTAKVFPLGRLKVVLFYYLNPERGMNPFRIKSFFLNIKYYPNSL
jgi:hypothetical protein